jgi:hypothetical protein
LASNALSATLSSYVRNHESKGTFGGGVDAAISRSTTEGAAALKRASRFSMSSAGTFIFGPSDSHVMIEPILVHRGTVANGQNLPFRNSLGLDPTT